MTVLPFKVRDVWFALPIHVVQRVLPMLPPERIGETPLFIAGVVALNNRPTLVIDFAVRLGWKQKPLSVWSVYIQIQMAEYFILLCVDEVALVTQITPPESLHDLPYNWPEALLHQVTTTELGLLYISDIKHLLTIEHEKLKELLSRLTTIAEHS